MIKKSNITSIEGLNQRSITRRSLQIDSTSAQQQDYNSSFSLVLYRVVLQVNRLGKPVVLYSSQPNRKKQTLLHRKAYENA